MNVSIDWHELSIQLVTTFAHFLWQAAIVGVLLVGVLRFLSQRSPQIQYVLACVAFASLPACVLLTFALVNRDGKPLLASKPHNEITAATNLALAANQLVATPLAGAAIDGPDNNSPTQFSNQLALPGAMLDRTTLRENQQNPLRPSLVRTSSPFMASIYIVGVLGLIGRFGISLWGGQRLRRTITAITDAEFIGVARRQAARIGLKRVPVVALSERVSIPIVIGIIKPMILLPPTLLCSLPPQHLSAILAHEMAHIRRYDLVINLIQRIIEAFLFFHPVTWWISRQVSTQREHCCDDLAARGFKRLEYVGALLYIAEQCDTSRGLKPTVQLDALAASGTSAGQLGLRIRRLLGEDSLPIVWITSRSIAASLALATLFGASAWGYAHTLVNPQQHAHDLPTLATIPNNETEESIPSTIPLNEVVWFDAGGGLETGFLLSTAETHGQRIPNDSLANYKIIVRNQSQQAVRLLARLTPHQLADTPYLIPSDNIPSELDLANFPSQFRSQGGPSNKVEAAYIISLAPGESAIIPGQQGQDQLGLFVGTMEPGKRSTAQIKKFKPGMNWIVQPIQIQSPPPSGSSGLLGRYTLTKISPSGITRQESASRILATPGGAMHYPRIQIEVGTLNANAVRNAKNAAWGIADRGLQCGIRLINQKTHFLTGDTLQAEVLWRNTSDATITTPIPKPLDLYPTLYDTNNAQLSIRFGGRINIYPVSMPFLPGEIRSLGVLRLRLVPDGTPPPKDNTQPAHVTLPPGKYQLSASGGVSGADTGNPQSAKVDFTVATAPQDSDSDIAASQAEVRFPYCIVERDKLVARPLSEAVTQFNAQSKQSPIGRLEAPITSQQTLDAISSFSQNKHVPEAVKSILSEIVDTKQLPKTAYFRRFTRYDDGQQMHRIWWVRLVIDKDRTGVYSVPVRTKELFSRPYTQLERKQIGIGITLLGRISCYFETAPKVVLLRDFDPSAKNQLIAKLRSAVQDSDDAATTNVFHWESVDQATRQFATTELKQLRGSHIESIKVRPRNFRGNLIHWSAFQHYRPNLPIVGYIEIRYRPKDQQAIQTISFEIGEHEGSLRLVNYVPHGKAALPERFPQNLSTSAQVEQLADGTYLISVIIKNPSVLLSGHIANEEIWKRNLN